MLDDINNFGEECYESLEPYRINQQDDEISIISEKTILDDTEPYQESNRSTESELIIQQFSMCNMIDGNKIDACEQTDLEKNTQKSQNNMKNKTPYKSSNRRRSKWVRNNYKYSSYDQYKYHDRRNYAPSHYGYRFYPINSLGYVFFNRYNNPAALLPWFEMFFNFLQNMYPTFYFPNNASVFHNKYPFPYRY